MIPEGEGANLPVVFRKSTVLLSEPPPLRISFALPLETTIEPSIFHLGVTLVEVEVCCSHMGPHPEVQVGGHNCTDVVLVPGVSRELCATPLGGSEAGMRVTARGQSSELVTGVANSVPYPRILAISPSHAGPADTVTIVGEGFETEGCHMSRARLADA